MKVPEPRQLPSGNWFIYLRIGGQQIPVTERTRSECVKTAQLIKAEYLAGREIRRKKLPPASEMTLRELLTSYIEKYKPVLSPATVRGYNVIKENRFQAFMDRKLREISGWQKVINAETGECGAKTLKNAWGLVSAAMKDQGIPVPDVTLPQIVPKPRPWLNAEEIRTFVAAVRGSEYEIPILLGLHGLRRSEIAALSWDRVDLKRGTLRVEGAVVPDETGKYVYKETNKSAAGRRAVPIMIPELTAALRAVPKADRKGPVVTCHINTIYKAVNRICEREGLPLIGAHGLRHSFASLGRSVGVPPREMQALGGWSDVGTMQRIYEHLAEADMLRARNAIADFFDKKDENVNGNANEAESD